MPTYLWRCAHCGKGREVIRRMADSMQPEFCTCGVPMQRELTAAMVRPDIAPYKAVTGDRVGKFITSRKEHREFLKRNRLIEVGDAPIRPTGKMKATTSRKEIREELKKVVPQALRNDRNRRRA